MRGETQILGWLHAQNATAHVQRKGYRIYFLCFLFIFRQEDYNQPVSPA